MKETGKNLCFRFSGYDPTEELHDDEVVVQQSNLQHQRYVKPFSDLGFYQSLWNETGGVVVSVEISEVFVRYNSYCHGIQSGYTVTFADGRKKKRLGPSNFRSSGYYSNHRNIRTTISCLYLDEKEFITGLNIRQGEVVDKIAVVTNNRVVEYGGNGGSPMPMMPRDPSSKIVAFAGILDGVCSRIGFYAQPLAWETVGPCILLRELMKQDRATANNDHQTKLGLLVHQCLSLDEGLFRYTIDFLIPTLASWS